MERQNHRLNDDSEFDTFLRSQFAASPLADDGFTSDVLAQIHAVSNAEAHVAAALEERRAAARRIAFAVTGAAAGVVLFVLTLHGLNVDGAAQQATESASRVTREVGGALTDPLPAVSSAATALAATLFAVGFVFWSALRRWAARQWAQLA